MANTGISTDAVSELAEKQMWIYERKIRNLAASLATTTRIISSSKIEIKEMERSGQA
jgi:hypothetical protein